MENRDLELWMHYAECMKYAKKFFNCKRDAEDLVSESLMKIMEKNRSENPPILGDNPLPYIKNTIKNLAIDKKRRIKIIENGTDLSTLSENFLAVRDKDNLEYEDFYKVIQKFNPNIICLIETKLDGLSSREGAEVMNMNEIAYNTLWFRVKKTLKQKFQEV